MKNTYIKPNMKTINIKAGQILCESNNISCEDPVFDNPDYCE